MKSQLPEEKIKNKTPDEIYEFLETELSKFQWWKYLYFDIQTQIEIREGNSSFLGKYDYTSEKIRIYIPANRTLERTLHTVLHELAHHIQYTEIPNFFRFFGIMHDEIFYIILKNLKNNIQYWNLIPLNAETLYKNPKFSGWQWNSALKKHRWKR